MYHCKSSDRRSNEYGLPAERRIAARQTLVLRIGVISDGKTEVLCLVRNVSAQGAQVRLFGQPSLGTVIILRVGDGEPIKGRVAWSRDNLAGIFFQESLAPEELLRANPSSGKHRRRAAPRVAARSPGVLRTGGKTFPVRLWNISPSGARLDVATSPAIQGFAVLQLPDMPPLRCHLRWTAANSVGVSFVTTLSLEAIANWLRTRASL